jgi:RNA polymerase sigma-70 factor (ECF subfamily)
MTENATILQAKEGNKDAFRSLYAEHREKIYRLAYRYTRSAEDSEDVMQETFIKAFKGMKSFDPSTDANFSAWILKIGIHCAIEHLRRMKRRKGGDHISLNDLPHELAAGDPEPDRAVAAARTLDWIQAAQRRLPPRQQVIFDLRYGQHLDIKEIAARMDCGESNVKTQLSRAVAKLRKQLEPAWGKL